MDATLTTLENVHAWLPIPTGTTSEDPLLTRLIAATSNDFQRATNRPDLMQADYSEVRQGDGAAHMILYHWPINSITTLTVGGVAVSASSDRVAPGYYIDADIDPERIWELYLNGSVFTDGAVIQIAYSAGYATVPGDIEQAVIDWVVYRYKGRPNVGTSQRRSLEGRGLGDTVDVEIVDAPPSTKSVIERYRRKVPSLDRRGDHDMMVLARAAAVPRRNA